MYIPLAKLTAVKSIVTIPAGARSSYMTFTSLPKISKTLNFIFWDFGISNLIVVAGLNGFG